MTEEEKMQKLEEKVQKLLKDVQASLHDQINALKSEVQRSVGDSEAALELSATLEKNIRELESGKFANIELLQSELKVLELMQKNIGELIFESRKSQLLIFINQQALRLSIAGTVKSILASVVHDVDRQFKYFDQLGNIIEFNYEFSEKIREATETKQIESLITPMANKYIEIENAISSGF